MFKQFSVDFERKIEFGNNTKKKKLKTIQGKKCCEYT